MEFPEPKVTQLTPSTTALEDVMEALFTHFNGGSACFTPSLDGSSLPIENGSSSGGDSFVIEPMDSSESWQLLLRRRTSDIQISIEPQKTVEDPGNTSTPATGTSVEYSGEITALELVPDGDLFVLEWDKAFAILWANSTFTAVHKGCHAGKIWSPLYGSDADDGRDGLGLIGNVPQFNGTLSASWFSTTANNLFRTGTTSWTTNVVAEFSSSTSTNNTLGAKRVSPIQISKDGRSLGFLDYLNTFPEISDLPLETIKDRKGAARYLYLNNTIATTPQIISWKEGVKITTGGLLSGSVTHYNLLPTDENNLTSPADGTYYNVTTTDAAGVYKYVASVGGFTVDMWFPAHVADRGLTYMEDASNNPARLSTRIGGDTKTSLEARGWVEGLTGGATITYTGGTIQCNGTALFDRSQFVLTPVISGDKTLFVVWEVNPIAISSNQGREAVVQINTGQMRIWFSLAIGNTPNNWGFPNDTTGFEGDGTITSTAFARGFGLWELNDSAQIGISISWDANQGYATGKIAGVKASDQSAGAGKAVLIYSQNRGTGTRTVQYREFHVFELGAP